MLLRHSPRFWILHALVNDAALLFLSHFVLYFSPFSVYRARAEREDHSPRKTTEIHKNENQLFRWQSVESSLQDRPTRRATACPRSLGESLSLWYHFISVGASPLDARRLPVAALRIRFGLAYLLWHGHERVRSSFTSSPRPIVPLFSLFFHMVVVPRVLTIPVVCCRPNRSEQRHLPSFVRVSSPFLKTKTSRLTSLLSLSRLAIHMDRASRFGSWFASDK